MGQEWLKADNFPAMILCSLKPKVNAYLWFCNTNQEEYVFALERDAIPPEVSHYPPPPPPSISQLSQTVHCYPLLSGEGDWAS